MTKAAVFVAVATASLALGSAASANDAFYAVGPRAPTEWVGVTPAQTDHTVHTTGSIDAAARRAIDAERRSDVPPPRLPR